MRIFIALLFPEEVKKEIFSLINDYENRFEGNYTSYDNLHLTLHYLGEISKDKLISLKQALKEVEFPSFSYAVNKIDTFKSDKVKKILHLRVEKSSYLKMLHQKVINILYSIDFPLENTNFTPHITLGRKVAITKESLLEINMKKITIKAEKISIMESKRVKDKLVYEEVDFVKLAK